MSFQRDCGLWEILLSQKFSRECLSAVWEQEKAMVLLLHAHFHGGSCKHFPLTVLVLSTESDLLVSFQR